MTKKGMPKLLDLALFVKEFQDEIRGPGSPGWFQRGAFAPLALVARCRRRALPHLTAKPAFA